MNISEAGLVTEIYEGTEYMKLQGVLYLLIIIIIMLKVSVHHSIAYGMSGKRKRSTGWGMKERKKER